MRLPLGLGRAFNRANLTEAGLIVAGGLGAAAGAGILNGAVARFLPAATRIPGYQYLSGLVTAGAIGGISSRVLPRQSRSLFVGALAQPVGSFVAALMSGRLTGGVSDFLTDPQVQAATQLTDYPQGVGDFLTDPQVQAATQLTDYPGGMGGIGSIAYDDGMGGEAF